MKQLPADYYNDHQEWQRKFLADGVDGIAGVPASDKFHQDVIWNKESERLKDKVIIKAREAREAAARERAWERASRPKPASKQVSRIPRGLGAVTNSDRVMRRREASGESASSGYSSISEWACVGLSKEQRDELIAEMKSGRRSPKVEVEKLEVINCCVCDEKIFPGTLNHECSALSKDRQIATVVTITDIVPKIRGRFAEVTGNRVETATRAVLAIASASE